MVFAIALTLVLALVIALMTTTGRRAMWSSIWRVKFEVVPNVRQSGLGGGAAAQFASVSNLLANPAIKQRISNLTGVTAGQFDFGGLRPMRATSIVELRFFCESEDALSSVGDAGINELQLFYATNLPNVRIEVVDKGSPRTPKPWWRSVLDSIEAGFSGSSQW